MSSAPIVDRIRIIPRPQDFLDRNVGASGEVFFSKETNSLRVYSGKDRSGFELARADLANVNITNDNINWVSYNTLDELPSATDNQGMFAYVESTGKAYYAHAGNWIELANAGESSGSGGGASVDVSETAPTEPEAGNLWLNTTNGRLYIYINDGDSSQWIQPAVPSFSGVYDDLSNKPALAPVATSGSYNDLINKPTFTESGFDGSYNTLTDTPTFATVATTGDYDDLINVPTSFTDLTLTGSTLNGTTTIQQFTEVTSSLTGATGVVAHDISQGAIFNHSSIASDFTANFTNVPSVDNRTIGVVLILDQGSTAYLPTAVQINSSSQNINWINASVPAGTANQVNLVSFTFIRSGGAWTVLGSLTIYG